jgi:ABC-type sugar transport system substrate-binding protein
MIYTRTRRTRASETATFTMSEPAIRLHGVLVVNDQSSVQWRAMRARIRSGRIVVVGTDDPPSGLFDGARNTFTITATDGVGRKRRYEMVTFAGCGEAASEYVFV